MKATFLLAALLTLTFPGGKQEPQRFESQAEMNAKQKREMKSRRFHVFRIRNKIQEAFLCATCSGSGSRRYIKKASKDWGYRVKHPCHGCGGSGLRPIGAIQDMLDEYCQRKWHYEYTYPFDAPLITGLEVWLLAQVKTLQVVEIINTAAHTRLTGKRLKDEQALLMAVEVFNTIDEGDGKIVQAWLKMGDSRLSQINLMLLMDELPPGTKPGRRLLVLAYNEGEEVYRNVFDQQQKARVLKVFGYRDLGRNRMPWDLHP